MKSIQFELWHECNNLCKFCFLGTENRITPIDTKIKSLKDAINNASKFKGDIISLIGGEFFQGQLNSQEVHDLFYDFISLIINKLNNKEIQESWVTATLTDKTPKDLIEFLNYVKKNWNGSGRLFLCTSYDTIGRFHTEEKRLNWEENMYLIRKIDPRIELNTTFILTNDLMEKFNNNEISFMDFSNKYNTGISIKHPNAGPYKGDLKKMEKALPGFVPKRKTSIKFFKKLKLKEYDIFYWKLFNVELRSDECVKRNNNGFSYSDIRDKVGINEYKKGFFELQTNSCGHSVLYQCYKDSDECMKCDYLKIKEG